MMNICGRGVFIVLFMCFASIQGKKISKAISSIEFMPDQKIKCLHIKQLHNNFKEYWNQELGKGYWQV